MTNTKNDTNKKEAADVEKKEIGARIKKRRKALRLTQKELADRIHKVEGSVRQYENGLRSPDETTKVAIANALGVSYSDLFVLDPRPMAFESPEAFEKAQYEAMQKARLSGVAEITTTYTADGIINEARFRFEKHDLSEREYNVFESLYSLLRSKDSDSQT